MALKGGNLGNIVALLSSCFIGESLHFINHMLSYQIFHGITTIQSHHMLEVGSAPGVHPIQCALQMKKLVEERLSDILKFTKPVSDIHN